MSGKVYTFPWFNFDRKFRVANSRSIMATCNAYKRVINSLLHYFRVGRVIRYVHIMHSIIRRIALLFVDGEPTHLIC